MSVHSTFRSWLIAQPGGSGAFRELVHCADADHATCELGDALSQWQLHFASRGASGEVREALRVAWWRYIEARAVPDAARPSPAERVVRSLERGWLQFAEPALGWMKQPVTAREVCAAPSERPAQWTPRRLP